MKDPIRVLGPHDIPGAAELVRDVFHAFVAPDYTQQGIDEFCRYIARDSFTQRVQRGELLCWGSFDGPMLAGVIACRSDSHISLLFVRAQYHRKGIARALEQTAAHHFQATGFSGIDVKSSPYALPIYEALGFVATGPARTENGIIYTPMRKHFA